MTQNALILIIICLLIANKIQAQDQVDIVTLTLDRVVELAIEQSPSIKYHQNRNVNYYWRWKNFNANFRPRLSLSGDLPDYQYSNEPITQPDGSIQFKQIAQLRTTSDLSLTQVIPHTGTTIYGASSLYRVQDFNNNVTEWNAAPFYVGFVQPLFAYNYWKWARMTEPLVYEESQKRYVESVERVSLSAASRFFNYLRIQTNFNLATNNLKNSQDNLKIAEVKRRLGQISENDFFKNSVVSPECEESPEHCGNGFEKCRLRIEVLHRHGPAHQYRIGNPFGNGAVLHRS
jgi:outer membrane protein